MARSFLVCAFLPGAAAFGQGTAFPGPLVNGRGIRSRTVVIADDAAPPSKPAAEIQFIQGVDEPVVPDIKLTRSQDGMTGTATFLFDQPSFLEASIEPQGEITGMYMIDEEGEMRTTEVNAKFVNGKPRSVEAVYIMRDPGSWDRMMRFLVPYGQRTCAARQFTPALRPNR